MTDNTMCRRSLPAKDLTTLSDPLPNQQSVNSPKKAVTTGFASPIDGNFAQMCAQDLPFDLGEALTFMHLLGREPWGSDAHIRAIPRKGLRHQAINGNLEMDCERFSDCQAQQKGIYVVANPGGRKKYDITSCVALFVEWDDRSIEEQLELWRKLGLPEPTFMVFTGGKSIHVYWVLTNSIEPARWLSLMDRLVHHCGSDANCKGLNRCMRLPGGWHIDANGIVGEPTRIVADSGHRYSAELFEQLLPELPKPPKHHLPRKVYSGSDTTLTDIAKALSVIPSRVAGQGDYSFHRNVAWSVKAACLAAGYDVSVAIDLVEAWSPSNKCGWNVDQVMRSGGEDFTAGTLFYHAKQYGYRRHE